jgi:hypothetical protein
LIVRCGARKCRFAPRIFVKNAWPTGAEARFDAGDQNLAEEIGPGIVRSCFNSSGACRCHKRVAIAFAIRVHRRKEIDAGKTRKGLANGQAFGFAKRIAFASPKREPQ